MPKPKLRQFPSFIFALSILIPGPVFSQAPIPDKPPSNDYKELIIGVIGGLVASITIFLWEKVWKRIIVPWYEERVYQDARINGEWKSTFKYQNEIHEELVEIRSQGHSITGKITVIKGKHQGKVFNFSGNFKNLILIGTYHSKKRIDLDRGTFTMLLTKNGSVLEGICALYKGATNSIEHAEYAWLRVYKKEQDEQGNLNN